MNFVDNMRSRPTACSQRVFRRRASPRVGAAGKAIVNAVPARADKTAIQLVGPPAGLLATVNSQRSRLLASSLGSASRELQTANFYLIQPTLIVAATWQAFLRHVLEGDPAAKVAEELGRR